jgi:hypothetical protein
MHSWCSEKLEMHPVAANLCHVFWEMSKKRTVSQSGAVWSFKCWRKLSEKCHNRWWNVDVWVWYRNKSAVVTLGGKIVAAIKKSMSESIEWEGGVDRFFSSNFIDLFFIGRALFIMSLFHVIRQSMDIFTWRSWSVWGRQCKGRRNKTWMLHYTVYVFRRHLRQS